jgi:hypothetical protein
LVRIVEVSTKRRRPGEVLAEFRQVEVVTGYGKSFAEVVKMFVVTEKTPFSPRCRTRRARTERSSGSRK